MRSPYSDPRLSLKARGLFALYEETGRVLSADEIATAVPEGRDSIRAGMKELKFFGYIKAVRHQVNGQWRTHLKFGDESKNQPFAPTPDLPTPGKPYVGKPGVLYIDSYIANSTNDNNSNKFTNVNLLLGDARVSEVQGGNEMGWPGIDDEQPKPRKVRIDSEDDSGAVGKVIDKAAMRRAKYKVTSFESTPASMRRKERDEETWDTKDLIAEFYDFVRDKAPGVPAQVNGKELGTWINKQVGEGTPRIAILKAIRMFFEDPRNLHDVGIGKGLMHRFMAYYTSVYGIVTRTETIKYVDDDFLAHQEKMLKLLEG